MWLEDSSSYSFFSLRWTICLKPIVSVGLGSDYDGIGSVPVGLEDVSKYPALVGVLGLW